jgi:phosphohistidine swiveling domain-containing protein
MIGEYTLPLADQKATLEIVGGKGASLARLAIAGLPVPGGFHVTTAAYKRFVAENDLQVGILAAMEQVDTTQPATLDAASRLIREAFSRAHMPAAIAEEIRAAYLALDPQSAVAVRSSATAEDLPEASFAGQQDSYLNIVGIDAVLEAVKRCWASLWTARAIGYRAQAIRKWSGIDQGAVSLAVVVQALVPAKAAGIMFTADPVSGRRDRLVINAAWGLGEAVVGGHVTPDTLSVDKASGHLLVRETGDKQVMTVCAGAGGTQERPVPVDFRQAPVLDDRQAAELAGLGVQIEQLYGMPVDIEWVLADGAGAEHTAFAIVQARPITALPKAALPPEAPLSIEWKLPDPKGQYMRTSIIDLMPDPLTPLFATLGLAALNAGIKRLTCWIARTDTSVFPDQVLVTINGYAYMIGRFTPGEWWWMLTKVLPGFVPMLRDGLHHWRDEVRPAYIESVRRWEEKLLASLSLAELWRGSREIMDSAADHLGAMMAGTLGPSAGSEALFTSIYDRLVKRAGDPPAMTFLMGYDTFPIQSEKALYDLAEWCRQRPGLVAYLSGTPGAHILASLDDGQTPPGVDADAWREWIGLFRAYLEKYGHSIYDLDFGRLLPRDDPAPMLETVKMYLRDEGANPHDRQQAAAGRREQAVQATLGRLKGVRRWIFCKSLNWAQRQAQVREDSIASVGLGYPVLRDLLVEMGRRFAAAGAIAQPDDIFWLSQAQVEAVMAALERGGTHDSLDELVRQRRATWQAEKRLTPPPMLPPSKKYLGLDSDIWLAASTEDQAGKTIKGVAVSAGRATGKARVLYGPEDFDQMQPGEVLVAKITTPAWTPLFAMAAAIVTDVGGPLSHGSIVAREYGIPAVLGTGVATRRIRSGQLVAVDGSAGTVTLWEASNGSGLPVHSDGAEGE